MTVMKITKLFKVITSRAFKINLKDKLVTKYIVVLIKK